MIKMVKPIVAKCDKCNNKIIESDIDMECVSSDEREMGPECQYEGIIESNCPNCGRSIKIKILAWEYPEGILNYSDIHSDGVTIIEKPQLSCEE